MTLSPDDLFLLTRDTIIAMELRKLRTVLHQQATIGGNSNDCMSQVTFISFYYFFFFTQILQIQFLKWFNRWLCSQRFYPSVCNCYPVLQWFCIRYR
ncbi:hypothetical protein BDV25DRAFT_166847 [Aspergillus avenaceus]|uniref:Uncharacterized protein n=1 Tax=Aspergillus avenaceus TaxID=36643 RepID=A0A5N6TDI2_ASPAV|nr:hypothetical protein BDV25DRAFT_166847 [Aspergillus avenaceus]